MDRIIMIYKKTKNKFIYGVVFALVIGVLSGIAMTETVTVSAASTYVGSPKRVSVHDPSIFKDTDGTYYIFGSHMADARTTDLINWTSINPDWNAGGRNWQADSVYKGSLGNVGQNLAKPFKWAGYYDADQANGIGVWAPDVIYNPDYVWTDGSGRVGAYMLYFCTSSTWRRSCIVFAVSTRVAGPYDVVDTLVYSGFTKSGEYDGNSTINTKWDNSYLNLSSLIANGTLEGVSDKWFSGNGWNAYYAPNAIDPNVFFDKDGKMYMAYGSWSGGLFVLELDKETGKAIYPGEDGVDEVSGNFVDRYFGTHIAGGNRQSGEGPYIIYDEETDYYYMYETIGSLLASGGYNMRLFRSKNVYGPYLDAAGKNSADSNASTSDFGIKLIGNYSFRNQAGYKAAGHNSALIDDDGQRYIIYHQRFSTNEYSHEIRVRRQYLNEDKWPVGTVYEYRDTDEEIENYEISDIIGTYEMINHGTATNGNMIASQTVYLNGDGTVTGDMTGTWKKKDSGRGYDYIKITTEKAGEDSDGDISSDTNEATTKATVYKGYFLKQYTERSTSDKVMTFSTIGSDNTCVWGSKTSNSCPVPEIDEEAIIELPDPDEPAKDPNSGDPNGETPGSDQNNVNQENNLPGGNTPGTNVTVSTDNGTTPKTSVSDSNTDSVPEKVISRAIFKSAKSKKKNRVILKWNKVTGADGYRIQYSLKKNFKSEKTINIHNGEKTKLTVKKLKSKKTYYFRIRAYQRTNNKTGYGKWSAVKKTAVR